MEVTLVHLREQIDIIDEKLSELLEERFALTEAVGHYKQAEKLPVMQEGREKIVLDKMRQQVTRGEYLTFIEAVFKSLLVESKKQQQLLIERALEAGK